MPIVPDYLQPVQGEYPAYYDGYFARLPDDNIFDLLGRQSAVLTDLLRHLTVEEQLYRYDVGKWSVKEVVGHLIDTERIFSYRGMRILRGDTTPLPGYVQDAFVDNGDFGNRSIESLRSEFGSLSSSNILLFSDHPPEVYEREGVASGHRISLRAIIAVMAAHVEHHLWVVKARYLDG